MSTKKVHNYEEASNSMYTPPVTTSSLTVGFVGTVSKQQISHTRPRRKQTSN